jgi:hypothetical protein
MLLRERVGDFGRRSRAISNASLFGACSHTLVRFLPPATLLFFLRLPDSITAVDRFFKKRTKTSCNFFISGDHRLDFATLMRGSCSECSNEFRNVAKRQHLRNDTAIIFCFQQTVNFVCCLTDKHSAIGATQISSSDFLDSHGAEK